MATIPSHNLLLPNPTINQSAHSLSFKPQSTLLNFPARSSPAAVTRAVSRTDGASISSRLEPVEKYEITAAGDVRRRDREAKETKSLRDTWRKIQGEDDWAGLMDPMDPVLRSELIRYGEMAQACYDAFDFDPFSRYCGSCRFTRKKLFDSLGIFDSGYEAARYLYATSNINLPNFFSKSRWSKVWSKNANWMGYVAVSDDSEATRHRLGRRDIAIAWRGTVTQLEWIADLKDFLKPVSGNGFRCRDPAVKAESGQMVNATLMNIADNLTNVQLPGMYNKEDNARVPIIVTGNDFSTLYAPLIRDGRMEKFYWAPTREDRIGVCKGIFRTDKIKDEDIVTLVDQFPGQSIDFFGALRARVYDDEVRKFVEGLGVEKISKRLVNSREGPPVFEQPEMTLEKLMEYGNMLVMEQENVKRVQLADQYLNEAALGDAN